MVPSACPASMHPFRPDRLTVTHPPKGLLGVEAQAPYLKSEGQLSIDRGCQVVEALSKCPSLAAIKPLNLLTHAVPAPRRVRKRLAIPETHRRRAPSLLSFND